MIRRPPGPTASVRFSLDGGLTWQRRVIENKTPKLLQDGSVRAAALGNDVCAVFERFNALAPRNTLTSDIVIVRDVSAGLGNFTTLPPVTIAKNQPIPYGQLGDERMGSDLSLVMDPNNFGHLYVAFAVQPGPAPYLVVYESTTFGATWTQVWKAPSNTGLPALAMTQNGMLGLLYTAYTAGNLETHLLQTGNDFSTVSDTVLSRFVNGKPAAQVQTPISATTKISRRLTIPSTAPSPPRIIRSSFLCSRLFCVTRVCSAKACPYSIDPFFFKWTVDNPQSFNGN
ncbi:MAG: hypothetical protein QM796_05445 [Chthoniobacteraceae bacterium]